MARKLMVMAAIISLVFIFQTTSGLADQYDLQNLGSMHPDGSYDVTWAEGRDGIHVGSAGSSFYAYSNTNPTGQDWYITSLNNNESKTEYIVDGDWVTVKTVYNTLDPNKPLGSPLFSAKLNDSIIITSYDTTITITAKYFKDPDPKSIYPNYTGQYTIYSEPGQYPTMEMVGLGTHNGTPFTFDATLAEMSTDHTHFGYFSDFTVTYPADPAAAPIPGAVWLLGSGLLGLAGLGVRRQRS
jgi:hypothetical protein